MLLGWPRGDGGPLSWSMPFGKRLSAAILAGLVRARCMWRCRCVSFTKGPRQHQRPPARQPRPQRQANPSSPRPVTDNQSVLAALPRLLERPANGVPSGGGPAR